jgi:hypothetical protein
LSSFPATYNTIEKKAIQQKLRTNSFKLQVLQVFWSPRQPSTKNYDHILFCCTDYAKGKSKNIIKRLSTASISSIFYQQVCYHAFNCNDRISKSLAKRLVSDVGPLLVEAKDQQGKGYNGKICLRWTTRQVIGSHSELFQEVIQYNFTNIYFVFVRLSIVTYWNWHSPISYTFTISICLYIEKVFIFTVQMV